MPVQPPQTQAPPRATPPSSARRGQKRTRQAPVSQPQPQTPVSESGTESEEGAPSVLPTVSTIARATTSLLWKLRFADEEKWFPRERATPAGRPFWTPLQQVFHRAYYHARTVLFPQHRHMVLEKLAAAVPMSLDEFEDYFTYLPGLLDVFTLPGNYVEDWVMIFYVTAWIPQDRAYVTFMFRGERYRLYRQDIAHALGLQLTGDRLHDLAYPRALPPRRPLSSGIVAPPSDELDLCFRGQLDQLPLVTHLT